MSKHKPLDIDKIREAVKIYKANCSQDDCTLSAVNDIMDLMEDLHQANEYGKSLHTYKLGDKVEIVDELGGAMDCHEFKIGTIVELVSHEPLDPLGYTWEGQDEQGETWWMQEGEFKPVSNE